MNNLSVPVYELDDGGFGDFDFRFLTVPIVNMKKKFALAVGFETSLPAATKTSLGSGALSFAPFGIKGTLIAPAYQHKFSVDEGEGRSRDHQGLMCGYFCGSTAISISVGYGVRWLTC